MPLATIVGRINLENERNIITELNDFYSVSNYCLEMLLKPNSLPYSIDLQGIYKERTSRGKHKVRTMITVNLSTHRVCNLSSVNVIN